MIEVPLTETFQFDAQGFVVLRGVLSEAECAHYLAELESMFAQDFDAPERTTYESLDLRRSQRRINGLIWNKAFHPIIDNPQVVARLRAWMTDPQLINSWAIDKPEGSEWGWWHRGLEPHDYRVSHGKIYTKMLNCIYFLTDNGPDDGCVLVVPGAHKSEFDLDPADFHMKEYPGTLRVTGKAGDVVLFTETMIHNGANKTTPGNRTNLYFNWIDASYSGIMGHATPGKSYQNLILTPEMRASMNDEQRALTRWMDWMRPDAASTSGA